MTGSQRFGRTYSDFLREPLYDFENDVFLYAPNETNPLILQSALIDKIYALLSLSPSFASLMNRLSRYDPVTLTFGGGLREATAAAYFPELYAIILKREKINPAYVLFPLWSIAHEFRHADQDLINDLFVKTNDPREDMLRLRFMEADAEAFAATVMFEMYENAPDRILIEDIFKVNRLSKTPFHFALIKSRDLKEGIRVGEFQQDMVEEWMRYSMRNYYDKKSLRAAWQSRNTAPQSKKPLRFSGPQLFIEPLSRTEFEKRLFSLPVQNENGEMKERPVYGKFSISARSHIEGRMSCEVRARLNAMEDAFARRCQSKRAVEPKLRRV